jgi:hypothetical protein
MTTEKNKSRYLDLAALLLTAVMTPLAPAAAQALECRELPPAIAFDPLQKPGFSVLAATNTYRTQDRPWSQIPTGARLLLRTPAGFTIADIHRAALCAASPSSPLSVPGAKLRVTQSEGLYQLHVTADTRSAALEIQRRANAL